jgi:hypothetical protein
MRFQVSQKNIPVGFEYSLKLGKDIFGLRSVVTVYRPPIAENVSVGSSCVVIHNNPGSVADHFYYNPLLANLTFDNGSSYERNKPISAISRVAANPNDVGFVEMAQKFGTVFMYVLE